MSRIEKNLLFLALLFLLGLTVSQIHSFDVFWQLQSGKYILQTKSFIYTDIFSLAPDAPRFEHCWLHDIILYLFYIVAGYGGISILKGLLLTGTAAALVAAARVRGAAFLSILFIFPAFFLTNSGWLERPQLWTFLCFALFVWVLERHRKTGDRGVIFLVPILALWVNLHAGSVLAPAIMASYLVGDGVALLFKRSPMPPGAYRRLLLTVLLLLAASLLTPYKSQLFNTLLGSADLGVSVDASGKATGPITALFNMDWRATSFAGEPYFFYALAFAGVLMLLGWRRLALTDLCLMAGLALMGLKLSRHTPFFFYGMLAILPAYADAAVRPIVSRLGKRGTLGLRLAGQVAAVAMIIYFALPVYRTYGLFNTGLRTWHYPIEATEFVQEHALPGNLYNTYDWGGYLMWELYPDYRVFWDGRQNSSDMFRLGLQVMMGHPGWDDVLDRFNVRAIVTKACTVDTGQHYPIIDKLRDSPEWALVFADESSMIFVRRSAVDVRWLKRHRLPDTRIDDTILSEATLLAKVNPKRYMAWNEMARIYAARKQYHAALGALGNYLATTPRPDPAAERRYRAMSSMVNSRR